MFKPSKSVITVLSLSSIFVSSALAEITNAPGMTIHKNKVAFREGNGVKIGSFSIKASKTTEITNMTIVSNFNIRVGHVTGNGIVYFTDYTQEGNTRHLHPNFTIDEGAENRFDIYGDVQSVKNFNLYIPINGIVGKTKGGIEYATASGFSIKKPGILMNF